MVMPSFEIWTEHSFGLKQFNEKDTSINSIDTRAPGVASVVHLGRPSCPFGKQCRARVVVMLRAKPQPVISGDAEYAEHTRKRGVHAAGGLETSWLRGGWLGGRWVSLNLDSTPKQRGLGRSRPTIKSIGVYYFAGLSPKTQRMDSDRENERGIVKWHGTRILSRSLKRSELRTVGDGPAATGAS
jgi:hypothetical protein